MSVEFAGQLFDSEHHRLRAIAQSWLTAGGLNDYETIHAWLDTVKPEGFADECLDGWFALEEHDDTRPDRDELIVAFRELATKHHRLRAIAQSWLTDNGLSDYETTHGMLDTLDSECLADSVLFQYDDTRPDRDELIEVIEHLASDRQWLEDQP